MSEQVELWLRSMSSWTVGRDGTFVDDLEVLSTRDCIESYEVNMWNDHVPVESERDLTRRERTIRNRVDTIQELADERGYELPAFDRTKKAVSYQGPSYEATVLPLAALLGFEDDELQWMAPYTDGDEHVSVQDRLDELATLAPELGTTGGQVPTEAE